MIMTARHIAPIWHESAIRHVRRTNKKRFLACLFFAFFHLEKSTITCFIYRLICLLLMLTVFDGSLGLSVPFFISYLLI